MQWAPRQVRFIPLWFAVLFGAAGDTRADVIVDQYQDTTCGGQVECWMIYNASRVGQEFRPTSELHVGVQLRLSPMNAGAPEVFLQLHQQTLDGPVVPGSRVQFAPLSNDWTTIEFESVLELEIDEPYVIEVIDVTRRWGWYRTRGYCYDRGVSYIFDEPGAAWDWYFRTLVFDDVIPAEQESMSAIKARY